MNTNINQSANQPRVTIDQTKEVTCDKCQGKSFAEGMFLRSVSPILTGQPKTSYLPIPAFYCTQCGHVNDEFIPNELKNKIVV